MGQGRSLLSDEEHQKLSDFGFELLKKLSSKDDNIVISPVSITTCLAMVAAASTDESDTQKELDATLGAKLSDYSKAHDLFRELKTMIDSDKRVDIVLANSVWSGAAVREDFVKMLAKNYDAEANPITDAAAINSWVEKKTKGLIPSILDTINPDDVCVLINAVFFKGQWSDCFDVKDTRAGKFKAPSGEVDCKYMTRTYPASVSMGHGKEPDVLCLPYGDHKRQVALLIKPTHGTDINALVASLSHDMIKKRVESLSDSKMRVRVPRFKVEYGSRALDEELQAMGIVAAYAAVGGFKRMSDDASVQLNKVLHRATLEVTEEGTVAAAATAAVMSRSLPMEFAIDSPFVFLVYDTVFNVVLFQAKLSSPNFI